MTKQFTLVLGIILLGIGIWGAAIGGHDHTLIIFGVNFNHNTVHILSGVVALVAVWMGPKLTKIYCISFGAVYGLVAVLGFLNVTPAVSMLNLNTADNFLHVAIAVGCLTFGLISKTGSHSQPAGLENYRN